MDHAPKGKVARCAEAVRAGVVKVVTNITVEPMIVVFNFSDQLIQIVLEQLKIDKACRQKFNFTDDFCDELIDHDDENEQVQNEVAQFNVYVMIVMSVFPALLSFYMGAWCDLFGRKVIMLTFFFAKTLYAGFMIPYSYYMEWPLELFLLAVAFPSLVGGDPAFNMSVYTFISDISDPDFRSFRMAMVGMCTMFFRPIATPLGAYFLNKGGYVTVMSISTCGFAIGGTWMWWHLRRMHWDPGHGDQDKNGSSRKALFSLRHIVDSIKAMLKERPGHRRMYLLLLVANMIFLYTPMVGEGNITYFYVRTRYGWEVDEYSAYSTITMLAGIIVQAVTMPTFAAFRVRDNLLLIFFSVSTMIRHAVQGAADEAWIFYLGAIVFQNYWSTNVIRAMISNCAPKHELGKVLALYSCLEGLIPLGVSQIYTSIWTVTSGDESTVGTVFFLSSCLTAVALAIAAFVHWHLRGRRLKPVDSEDDDDVPTSSPIQYYDEEKRAKL